MKDSDSVGYASEGSDCVDLERRPKLDKIRVFHCVKCYFE